MPLADGQVQLRSLVFGADTNHRMVTHFNPFIRSVRADEGDPRAWNNGAWSGAEFAAAAVIPMRIVALGQGTAQFLSLHRQLAEAFAPSSQDLELRFAVAGSEYVMYGRPRLVEPAPRNITGIAWYQAAFVALDPLIYSGIEHTASTGLPVSTGGLTIPLTVPFSIEATFATGRVTLTNAGTAPAGLRLRITGPVLQPRVALLTAAGTYTVSFFLDLGVGQFLDVDTADRTVYLQGTASRRGFAAPSDLGWPVLPPGTSELAFFASTYDAAADLDVFWRDAWF
jgi:hypothetical protein